MRLSPPSTGAHLLNLTMPSVFPVTPGTVSRLMCNVSLCLCVHVVVVVMVGSLLYILKVAQLG